MSEWPEAPRLVEALRRRSEEPTIDEATRARVRAQLDQGVLRGPSGDEEVTVVRIATGPGESTPRGRRRSIAVAAALVVIALSGVVSLVVLGSGEPTGVVDRPVPSPVVTTGPPSATALTSGHCTSVTGTPEPFVVGSSTVVIAGEDPGSATVRSIVVLAEGELLARPEVVADAIVAAGRVVYVVGIEDDPAQVVTEVVRLACGGARVLVDAGTGRAPVVACLDFAGTGFGALVLFGQEEPVADCSDRQRMLVVDDAPMVAPDAWAGARDCTGSTERTDGDDNTIRSFEGCRAALTHVDTASDDPLTATIEGEPALRWAIDAILGG